MLPRAETRQLKMSPYKVKQWVFGAAFKKWRARCVAEKERKENLEKEIMYARPGTANNVGL